MTASITSRLSREELLAVRSRHPLSSVLARVGIDVPAGWVENPGRSDLRAPCPCPDCPGSHTGAASFIAHRDDETWFCFRQDGGGDVLELVGQVTGHKSLAKIAAILDAGGPIVAKGADPAAPAAAQRLRAAENSEHPDVERTPIDRVREVNAAAWRFYTLPKLAAQGREYLAGRGIDLTALEAEAGEPLVGYTPRSSTGLVDNLRSRGFSDDELVDAGWARRKPGQAGVADTFHDRVLMPFRDDVGRVTGVTGRSVTWRSGDQFGKYLNHRRTAVFDKSKALYRPVVTDLAPAATVIAVEGTLDALAIAAAAARVGLTHMYAPCTQSGLSLTDEVAPAFFALHPHPPILCADGDGPGQQATAKWAVKAMDTYRREVCVLTLPDGKDPAEWLSEHGDSELRAFTRKGCLDDLQHVRAEPAGRILAAAAYSEHAQAHPSAQPWQVADSVAAELGGHAANLTSPAARARFADSAAAALAAAVDGESAGRHAARILGHAARVDAERSADPFVPAAGHGAEHRLMDRCAAAAAVRI